MNVDFDRLWKHIASQFHTQEYSIHGPDHWLRVERNGLLLATRTGADVTIVRLFAIFHDSRRESDGWDQGHGARGAALAKLLRGKLFDLSEEDFEILHYACTWHTEGKHHENPTIATCWDADRLDLGRVGIIPSREFMSTDFGREIADYGSIQPFISNSVNAQEQ
jgi:uncharacterized protein